MLPFLSFYSIVVDTHHVRERSKFSRLSFNSMKDLKLEMFRNNPSLVQLKQRIQENLPRKEGVIRATEKGFGFLEIDKKTSLFVPPIHMRRCMHGDKVLAIVRTQRGRKIAEPEKLLDPMLTRFVGRVVMEGGEMGICPDYPQLKRYILRAEWKTKPNEKSVEVGDWVVARQTSHPLKGGDFFFAEVVRKITGVNDKNAPWSVALAQGNLPSGELEGVENWQQIDDPELERVDTTDIPFVSIDGHSTKDIDDALYAVKKANGDFELTVAIADPTAYIAPNDRIDKAARSRGYTIYLPSCSIPMLPRDITENRCPLIENEVRLALCCRVAISKNGDIQKESINFFAAVVRSRARLTYDDVSDFIDIPQSQHHIPSEAISKILADLYELSLARSKRRGKDNTLFPDRPDYRFELNEEKEVVAVHKEIRRSANYLVEEAMITANICAGHILKKRFGTGIFNSHPGFKVEKIPSALALLTEHGMTGQTLASLSTLQGFATLKRWLLSEGTPYIRSRVRKLQACSEIGSQPLPHFAMGLDVYATWTSPLRKYGDMINHRMLKAHILGKDPVQVVDNEVSRELTTHRRHHKTAERAVSNRLYVNMLANEPSKKSRLTGEVIDVNRAGMRVLILENGAVAFIPGTLIIPNRNRLECNAETGSVYLDGKPIYKLGDRLEVTLTEVDKESCSILAKPAQSFS